MKSSSASVMKDLVLIGGGHSHVGVLRSFGMNPVPGVRLTVIARDVHTPYSGMLPGYVAGHYSFDEAHIDLRPLCQFAGARLYHDSATGIDPAQRLVHCENRPAVSYDLLSIDIGSRPQILDVPGAAEHTVPVKPINRFVDRWHRFLDRVMHSAGPHRVAVVGAGAAGVELLLAIQYRLQGLLAEQRRAGEAIECHLISKSERILPAFPAGVARRFDRILSDRGVRVHRGSEATRVEASSLSLSNGDRIEVDEVLWVTGASAPEWLKSTGISLDEEGFISARDTLQTHSHGDIFAAGDIVHVTRYPRPKAGVFAVRQGPPLTRNLRLALMGETPKPFRPQETMLALISTGDAYAIASKGPLHLEGAWIWRWKDWIDRRFMRSYSELPQMERRPEQPVEEQLAPSENRRELSALAMRCGGCGAKVSSNVLSRAIADLQPIRRDDILIGLHEPDDAAVVSVPPGKVLVQSVDYFRAFLDDPFLFGRIAANHALSDLFAMGAEAQSALAIATLPYGLENKVEQDLRELMAGAIATLNESGTALVGGHTAEGAEMALGFSVNGLADREQILRKGGMQPGESLILTKALGTGTLFAADMQHKARGRWIEAALQSMLQSNREAARILHAHGASACTDVTGFGLLGHLVEMTRSSGVDVRLNLQRLPVIEGARETLAMGIVSSLQPSNLRLAKALHNAAEASRHPDYPLIFDPQTSGGLLATIPSDAVDACLSALQAAGYTHAVCIGEVLAASEGVEPISVTL